MWLRKQFLRNLTSRHWLISFRLFKEMFFETANDKSVIFLHKSEKPLPSYTLCFSRRTKSSHTNMAPKYKVYFLNLEINSKLPDFSSSCSNKNRSLYRPGQTLKVPGIRVSRIPRQPAHDGGKVVNPRTGSL
jgi:hypothetical protein